MFCLFQEIIILITDILIQIVVTKVEISDFNVLIDGKSFLDLPVKNAEAYKKIIEISNNDYTTGNLLDFAYFKKHYKLITIDLSIQTKLKGPQQINFIGKLLKILEQQFFLSLKNQIKRI